MVEAVGVARVTIQPCIGPEDEAFVYEVNLCVATAFVLEDSQPANPSIHHL